MSTPHPLAIARGASPHLPISFPVARQVHHGVMAPHYLRVPHGVAWRQLLESLVSHELDATILDRPAGDRGDPAVLVEMCSSAVLDAALAAYARRGGTSVVNMPVLFRDDEPPAAG